MEKRGEQKQQAGEGQRDSGTGGRRGRENKGTRHVLTDTRGQTEGAEGKVRDGRTDREEEGGRKQEKRNSRIKGRRIQRNT